jgi:acyl-CoA hydrolase
MPTAERQITLRFLAAPNDAGYSGNVSGGRVLEWIDKAGYACAVGWFGAYSVTAYVGNVRFSRPVRVGDLVEATAKLVHTGRSSMHILVNVRSGSVQDRVLTDATQCLMIFVAMGADGRPTLVPPWQPVTADDREQQAAAQRRVELRADIEAAMADQQYTDEGTAPSVVLRFLAAPTDVNWGGKVHGGIVMRWIDEAAHVLASQWISSPANVAVYAGGVRFYRPLLIGNLVEVEARLLLTVANQMHISVHVRSSAATTSLLELTTHSLIVFAPDEVYSTPAIPAWHPVSAEDRALEEHAMHLVQLRSRLGPSSSSSGD